MRLLAVHSAGRWALLVSAGRWRRSSAGQGEEGGDVGRSGCHRLHLEGVAAPLRLRLRFVGGRRRRLRLTWLLSCQGCVDIGHLSLDGLLPVGLRLLRRVPRVQPSAPLQEAVVVVEVEWRGGGGGR